MTNKDILFDAQAKRFIKNVENSEMAAFNETAFASDEEAKAYDEALKTWHAADILDDNDIDDLLALDSQEDQTSAASRFKISRKHAPLLFGLVTLCFLSVYSFLFSVKEQSYHTAKGTESSTILTDGTVLTIGGNSMLSFRSERNKRSISLISGNVFFEVAPDKERPFIIETPTSTIEVVGTAFNIFSKNGVDEIVVTHGIVNVSTDQNEALLTKNQKITISENHFELSPSINAEMETSWRSGKIHFENESLEVVISKISDHYRTPILIQNPDIRTLKLTGSFSTDDLEGFLMALKNITDIQINRRREGEISLY